MLVLSFVGTAWMERKWSLKQIAPTLQISIVVNTTLLNLSNKKLKSPSELMH